jgi:hypothetical protein
MAGDDTPRTEAGHPWDKHDDSCDCHIGICGDCGCTNEYSEASATPPSTEGLAEAWNDHSYSHSGGCTAAGCLADILARLRSTQDET